MATIFSGVKFLVIGVTAKQHQIISKNIALQKGSLLDINNIIQLHAPATCTSSSSIMKKRKHGSNKIIDNFVQSCKPNSSWNLNINSNMPSFSKHYANLETKSNNVCSSHNDGMNTSFDVINFLNEECHYIICDTRSISIGNLSVCLKSHLDELVNLNVPVVHTSWLTSCINQNTRLSIDNYVVRISHSTGEGIDAEIKDVISFIKPSSENDSKCGDRIGAQLTTAVAAVPSSIASSSSNGSTALPSNISDDKDISHQIDTNSSKAIICSRRIVHSDTKDMLDVVAAAALCRHRHVPMLDFDYLTDIERIFLTPGSRSSEASQGSSSVCSATSSTDTSSQCHQWYEHKNMMFRLSPFSPRRFAKRTSRSAAVAQHWSMEYVGFDMDGTLIRTKSGKKFPTDVVLDWTLWSPTYTPLPTSTRSVASYFSPAVRVDTTGKVPVVACDVTISNSSTSTSTNRPQENLVLAKLKNILLVQKKSVLIVSNQNGVQIGKLSRKDLMTKIDSIVAEIYRYVFDTSSKEADAGGADASSAVDRSECGSVDVVCSIADGLCRKPCTGSYDWFRCVREQQMKSHLATQSSGVDADAVQALVTDNNSGVTETATVNMTLFVGDAAGRVAHAKTAKDFGDSDLKFALNVGCDFATPEEYFSLDKVSAAAEAASRHSELRGGIFLAALEDRSASSSVTRDALYATIMSPHSKVDDSQDASAEKAVEVVLLVGPPATGKSTLALQFERQGYVRVNRDTLGSLEKCIHTARAALSGSSGQSASRKSVVVDNTNLDRATRGKWIGLAKELNNLQIRCVYLSTPLSIALTLNRIRTLASTALGSGTGAVQEQKEVPDWVITKYFKEYQTPTLDEGFSRIDTLPFSLLDESKLTCPPIARRLYESYL